MLLARVLSAVKKCSGHSKIFVVIMENPQIGIITNSIVNVVVQSLKYLTHAGIKEVINGKD